MLCRVESDVALVSLCEHSAGAVELLFVLLRVIGPGEGEGGMRVCFCFGEQHTQAEEKEKKARGEEGGPACWIDVPPYPTSSLSTGGGGGNPSSTFVVLIGDMLE